MCKSSVQCCQSLDRAVKHYFGERKCRVLLVASAGLVFRPGIESLKAIGSGQLWRSCQSRWLDVSATLLTNAQHTSLCCIQNNRIDLHTSVNSCWTSALGVKLVSKSECWAACLAMICTVVSYVPKKEYASLHCQQDMSLKEMCRASICCKLPHCPIRAYPLCIRPPGAIVST